MNGKKLAIILAVILLAACVVLYIIAYTIPGITGALTKTVIVEYDHFQVKKHLPAVIVRDETVYTADRSGNISYYVDDNTKTRKGIKVLDIYGSETSSVYCPETGVVSFYYDGYEAIFRPDNMVKILDFIPQEGSVTVTDMQTERVSRGDFTYKLIKGDVWYTVVMVPLEEFDDFEIGAPVTLEFETGKVDAHVYQRFETGQTCLVAISTGKYFKDYDKIRQCEVDVILHDDTGLIIPNTAIAYNEEEQPGVYKKSLDGEYDFIRIKIINTDGTDSVVASDTFKEIHEDGLTYSFNTIGIYDEILKDASEKNQ